MKTKTKNQLIIITCVILSNLALCTANFKKVCYFTNWAQFRATGGEFYPEDINPDLCTHIIYAFARIENYSLTHTEENDIGIDNGPGMYERIMALKLLSPSLKIMLAVGGWAQGSSGFDTIVENEETMDRFAFNSIEFLRKWKFDGLDVDWEFPVIKKTEFTKLLEKLRISFENEKTEDKDRLELSIAVSAGQATIDTSYEVEKISQHVDFVNLMAYDFHGSWSTKTGFHSALYSKIDDMSWENTLNADWSVKYWLEKGCPKEKLILGIAFYGRGFKLSNPDSIELGAPSSGSSKAGSYTKEAGFLSYFEICEIIKKNNLVESYNNELGVPSIVYGSEWIGYENQESVIQKANYIKDNCLGGAMVWTIDFDDFKGKFCNQGNYPLMIILNEVLKNSDCTFSTTTTDLSTTSIETTEKYTEFTQSSSTESTSTETSSTDSTESFSTESTSTETSSTDSTEPFSTESTSTETSFSTQTTESSTEIISATFTESTSETKPSSTEDTSNLSSEKTHPTTSEIGPVTDEVNNEPKIDRCNGKDFLPSPDGCEYYQICLRGFPTPVATLKCPDDNWFDMNENTCIKNRPDNCGSFQTDKNLNSTTLFPMVTPDTTIFVYVTAPDNSKIQSNTTKSSSTSISSTGNLTEEEVSTTRKQTSPKSEPTTTHQTSRNTVRTRPSSTSSLLTKYTTTLRTTEKIRNKKFYCPEPSGIFPNLEDCRRFWHCSNNMAFDKNCPGNLVFDNKLKTCAWSSDLCKANQDALYDKQFGITKPPYTQPSNAFVCPQPNGSFIHTKNCKLFYQCIRGIPYLKSCPAKLMFNEKTSRCDFISNCSGRFKIHS